MLFINGFNMFQRSWRIQRIQAATPTREGGSWRWSNGMSPTFLLTMGCDSFRTVPDGNRWKGIRLGPCEHSTIFVGDASEITIDTVWTWNLMESHGISISRAWVPGSWAPRWLQKPSTPNHIVYIYIYLYIYSIYLFKKILYNYTILQVIPHASGYRLELPTLSVCWVPLARPSFHRSVHMHPLRNVHYSVL